MFQELEAPDLWLEAQLCFDFNCFGGAILTLTFASVDFQRMQHGFVHRLCEICICIYLFCQTITIITKKCQKN